MCRSQRSDKVPSFRMNNSSRHMPGKMRRSREDYSWAFLGSFLHTFMQVFKGKSQSNEMSMFEKSKKK